MRIKTIAAISGRYFFLIFTWQHDAAIYKPQCGEIIGKIAERNILVRNLVMIAIGANDGKLIIFYPV